MVTKFTFHELHSLGSVTTGDRATIPLPFEVMPGVTVADMSTWLTDETLDWVSKHIGIYQTEALKNVRFALVHRYVSDSTVRGTDEDLNSERLVRNLIELTHVIRPMRQKSSIVRAEQTDDNQRKVVHLDTPNELEVPEVQKLFGLRDQDLIAMKQLAPSFLQAMQGNASKFRSSVFYHSVGRNLLHGNAKYLLWCSAIEAIYTSHSADHQGKLVATERIKQFLGAKTPIYEPSDFPDFWAGNLPDIKIQDVVDKLYTVRNYMAHGDIIPKKYFDPMRQGIAGDVSTIEVLGEAASFIIRKSLLRILTDGLLDKFEDAASSDAYFGAFGLTKPLLSKVKKP